MTTSTQLVRSSTPTALTLTAVVCAYTHHRWGSTVAAVASLQRQTASPIEILLVIDHNPALYRAARWHYLGQRSVTVLENRHGRGLSGARNTGAGVARGDVIAFLDDDATIIGDDWAAGILAHFADHDVQVVGGSALPTATAAWLPPEFYWVIGCSYTGQPCAPAAVRNVLGCNMAVRRDALTAVGPFDGGIGRGRGRLPMGNEETDICIRITREIAGARVLYDPGLAVRHEVTAERTTVGYFTRRCYAEGLSKARLSATAGAGAALSSERAYTTGVLPRAVVRELRCAARGEAAGFARLAALVGGFTVTVAGYLHGLLARGARR